MSPLLTIGNEVIPVRPNVEHEYVLESKLVAKGYGVSESSLREHRRQHPDELIEGKHFVAVSIPDAQPGKGAQFQTLWTKRGIVRLGFFIRSGRAKLFRDMAEDLVVHVIENRDASEILSRKDWERIMLTLTGRIAGADKLIGYLAPKHEYGSLTRDGRPRFGFRRATWTVTGRLNDGQRVHSLANQLPLKLESS